MPAAPLSQGAAGALSRRRVGNDVAGEPKSFLAAATAELLNPVAVLQQKSVVDAARRALPAECRVEHVFILAAVCGAPRITSLPGVLGPQHFAPTLGARP